MIVALLAIAFLAGCAMAAYPMVRAEFRPKPKGWYENDMRESVRRDNMRTLKSKDLYYYDPARKAFGDNAWRHERTMTDRLREKRVMP